MEPTGTTTSLLSKIIFATIITVSTWLTFGLCWFFIPVVRRHTGKVGKIFAAPVAFPLTRTTWGEKKDLMICASVLAKEMEDSNKSNSFLSTK